MPLRPVEDLFGGRHLVCFPHCPMSFTRAVEYVRQVAGRIVSRSPEGNAVHHALVGAVLAGERFEDEADVWRWLLANTGLRALEVARC